MEESTIVMWVLAGFGGFQVFMLGIVIQMRTQTAVLQKTVDSLVSRVDLFLKTEVDTLKELVNR